MKNERQGRQRAASELFITRAQRVCKWLGLTGRVCQKTATRSRNAKAQHEARGTRLVADPQFGARMPQALSAVDGSLPQLGQDLLRFDKLIAFGKARRSLGWCRSCGPRRPRLQQGHWRCFARGHRVRETVLLSSWCACGVPALSLVTPLRRCSRSCGQARFCRATRVLATPASTPLSLSDDAALTTRAAIRSRR